MKQKTLLFILALLVFQHIDAQIQKVTKDNINYVLEKGKAYILDFDKKATKVTIVSEITHKKQTYKVVGVYDEYYAKKARETSNVQEMIFAEGITIVFKIAEGMENLERVVLPSTVTTIGGHAFEKCKSLVEINIPDNIKLINDYAFGQCESLQNIELPNGLCELGSGAFWACSSLKKVTLPQTLKTIGAQCFWNCKSLQDIVIPHSVISLGKGVFLNCISLETAIILCEIKEMPEELFYNCNSLRSIVIPNSVRTFGIQVFKNCKLLTDIILPDKAYYLDDTDAAKIKKNNIQKGTFFGCDRLSNIKCHNGSVPEDIMKYIPASCPFAMNGGKSLNPDFDTRLLASMAKYISGESVGVVRANQHKNVVKSDVDIYIPETNIVNETTFAVIIGNENYKSVPSVPYAEHDARMFAEYCKKTLGLPEKNVSVFCDASYAEMIRAIKLLKMLSQAYDGKINVLFYYSGHGIPDESTHDAFLLPVDADGTITEVCYGINKLYKDLTDIKANRILVFLDACFSGARRDGGVLQAMARGVAIKAKKTDPIGNMVVFSAATGDETAYPFEVKSHGMFTYYLLKKIKETKGNVSLGELADYVKTNVTNTSAMVNKKVQTPTITSSHDINATWKMAKLDQ